MGDKLQLNVRSDVPDIESLVSYLPPCMRRIYNAGHTGECHIKHIDRLRFISFCHTIGVRDKDEISQLAEGRPYDIVEDTHLKQDIDALEKETVQKSRPRINSCKFLYKQAPSPGNVIKCEFSSTLACGQACGIPDDLRRFITPAGFVRASLENAKRNRNKKGGGEGGGGDDAMDLDEPRQ
jgi:hypothetical protein